MEDKLNALEHRADDFAKWRNQVDVKLAVNEEHNTQISESLKRINTKQDEIIADLNKDRLSNREGSTKLTMIYSGCLVLLGTLLHGIVGKLSAVLMGGGK